MSDCKTFNSVTAEIFDCVKKASGVEHGTVYDPPSGNSGTATTETKVGKVVLSFELNPGNGTVTYCIVSKPWVVPSSAVFNGISDSIDACGKK